MVRGPGDEDPLVSLCILGVQAIQDVARLLRREQREQALVVVFVPAVSRLSEGIQHQLLCTQTQAWSSPTTGSDVIRLNTAQLTVSDDNLHDSDGTSLCPSQKLFQLRCC